MKIRTLIVDDMLLARKRVKRFLHTDPDIEIIGECSDGRDAIEAIKNLSPDLIFLDVQMPELDGFEVLEAVGSDSISEVIFITAYDQFALRAFEVHALDYLLKPFDFERLRKAVDRAKSQIKQKQTGDIDKRLSALINDIKAGHKYLKRLIVKAAGRTIFLLVEEIDWIEAAGNYLRLQAGKESYMIRERMSQMESKLDPDKFVRIHRSTLVNIDRIKELQPLFNGDQLVILRDGKQLTMSRTYRERLMSILDEY
jgi:two-component system, LytTR family, response regulator